MVPNLNSVRRIILTLFLVPCIHGQTVTPRVVVTTAASGSSGVDIPTFPSSYSLGVRIHGAEAKELFTTESYGTTTYPGFYSSNSRGTESVPTAVLSGNHLGIFAAGGYDGAAIQRAQAWVAVDAPANWSVGDTPTSISFWTTPVGSATVTKRFEVTPVGGLLGGLASTDVSYLPGAIISGDAFVSATAAVDASVGSFSAISGNYVALASSKSGTGTYLPMAFFTQATEKMRLTVSGGLFVGLSTTDISYLPGAIITTDAFISATATTNASVGSLKADAAIGTVDLASGRTGSGTFLPIAFWTNNLERFRVSVDGAIYGNLASTDVSYNAGAFISKDAFISATAAANASVGSFSAVASNYVAVASSKTGSGTYLPLSFFTSAAERFRIDTSGGFLGGITSTDVSYSAGALITNQGFVSVSAAANASVGSFQIVGGSYLAVGSNKTGSGTYLPISFFTSATRQWDIDTNGNFVPQTTNEIGSSGSPVSKVWTTDLNIAGTCTGCGGSSYLRAAATSNITTTTSLQDVTGASITLNRNGYWLIIGTFKMSAGGSNVAIQGHLDVGGADQTGNAVVADFNANGIQATATQTWVYNNSGSTTAKLTCKQSTSGGTHTVLSADTFITAMYIGP